MPALLTRLRGGNHFEHLVRKRLPALSGQRDRTYAPQFANRLTRRQAFDHAQVVGEEQSRAIFSRTTVHENTSMPADRIEHKRQRARQRVDADFQIAGPRRRGVREWHVAIVDTGRSQFVWANEFSIVH